MQNFAMLKILHVYRTFFPDTQGGLEETIRQIAKGTNEEGAIARVFTVSKNVDKEVWIEFDGIDVILVPELIEVSSCNIPRGGICAFSRQAQWADVVHFHFPWPYGDFLRFFVPATKKVVVTYHSDIIRQRILSAFYAPLMHRFFNSVDRIVCTSPNYFATSPVLKKYQKLVDVVPIGLNPAVYPSVDNNRVRDIEMRLGRGFFLFVGVLRYYKGLEVLLDASLDANFRVVIVGSGPIENELRQKAELLSIENVIFLGRVSDEDKVALFKLCCAVVFPSFLRSEAYGVTLLEGAIYSKPLISTEIGTGTSYVNKHMESGLVIPPNDSHSLRCAMDVLSTDQELAQRLGAGARQRFDSLFTAKEMCEKYYAIYRELVGESSSRNRESYSREAMDYSIREVPRVLSIKDVESCFEFDSKLLTVSTVLYKTGIAYVRKHIDAMGVCAKNLFEGLGIKCRLFLVDNSDSDSYLNSLRELLDNDISQQSYFNISLIRSHRNVGYGRANNAVLPCIHSQFHLITNPDVIVAPDTLVKAVSYMEKTPECGLLTPHVNSEADGVEHVVKSYPDCFSLALRYLGSRRLTKRYSQRLERYERRDVANQPASIEFAGGCFMFIRARSFLNLGGFDKRFFMYFEDFDLCVRVREREEIHYVPDVRIKHYGGDVGRKSFRHHLFFAVSALRFFNRYGWKFF